MTEWIDWMYHYSGAFCAGSVFGLIVGTFLTAWMNTKMDYDYRFSEKLSRYYRSSCESCGNYTIRSKDSICDSCHHDNQNNESLIKEVIP